jgi:hypothetical protein
MRSVPRLVGGGAPKAGGQSVSFTVGPEPGFGFGQRVGTFDGRRGASSYGAYGYGVTGPRSSFNLLLAEPTTLR